MDRSNGVGLWPLFLAILFLGFSIGLAVARHTIEPIEIVKEVEVAPEIDYQEMWNEQQITIQGLITENEELRLQNAVLLERVEELVEHLEPLLKLEVSTAIVTNYAPLDPNAIEGMCYSGNPNITASGQQVVVGHTAAADPSIPFGTKVWIEGYGWRVVQDRGGAIRDRAGYRRLDVAIQDKQTAYSRGPHERLVIIDWRD